jgi:hypothetical protein
MAALKVAPTVRIPQGRTISLFGLGHLTSSPAHLTLPW